MQSSERILYKSTLLSAFCLSAGACSGAETGPACFAAVLASLSCVIVPGIPMLPFFLGFLTELFVLQTAGTAGAFLALLLCAVYSVFLMRGSRIRKLLDKPEIQSPLMLAAAFSVTVLITTHYFGIGASGATVLEMLKNYRSLGFHPNWRGILYGTIVMVIMITYPRKFKKISKIINSAFIAVVFTWILNFILIPPGTISTITLLEKPVYSVGTGTGFASLGSAKAVLTVVLASFALAAVMLMTQETEKKRTAGSLYDACYLALTSRTGLFFPAEVSFGGKDQMTGNIISAALTAALLVPTFCFTRLPLASCAVVLIVGAWQSVEWGLIKKAFSSPVKIITFFVIVAVFVFTTAYLGIIAAFVLSLLTSFPSQKKKTA